MRYELEDDEVALVIKPLYEPNGEWEGDVATGVAMNETISIATSTAGWTIRDETSTTQIIGGGNTLSVLGTSNQIQAVVSATDTLTLSLPNDVTIPNSLTALGTTNTFGSVEISGNNIRSVDTNTITILDSLKAASLETGSSLFVADENSSIPRFTSSAAGKALTFDAVPLFNSSVEFDGVVFTTKDGTQMTLKELSNRLYYNEDQKQLTATSSYVGHKSPPPFMAGFVELDIDTETGEFDIIDYVSVVDCGTTINPKLALGQVEGGIVQGIGFAVYENVHISEKGKMLSNSFLFCIPILIFI